MLHPTQSFANVHNKSRMYRANRYGDNNNGLVPVPTEKNIIPTYTHLLVSVPVG